MNNHKFQKGDLVLLNSTSDKSTWKYCRHGFIIGFGVQGQPHIQFADGFHQYFEAKFLKLLSKANK